MVYNVSGCVRHYVKYNDGTLYTCAYKHSKWARQITTVKREENACY